MKRIHHFICLVLFFLSITSCREEELLSAAGDATPVSLCVVAENFMPNGTATRATEEGYVTRFAAEDRIGIFAVSATVGVLDKNIPYKYSGTAWVPVDAANTVNRYDNYLDDVTYFAYYPYSATMDDAASEADIVTKFTPKTDQTLYADYTASDLMTGSGTLTGTAEGAYTLTLQLKHQMTLLVLCPDPFANCVAPTGAGYEYYSESRSKGTVTNAKISNAATYAVGDDTYRLIVKPATMDVPLEYTLGTTTTSHTFTGLSLTAGTYRQFNLGHAALTIEREMQIGDYYHSDGKLAPGADGEEPVDKDNCIGVVFHIGPGNGDDVSKYSGTGLKDKIQGYVIAKKLYANNFLWSATNEDIGTIKDKEQFVGYGNTVIMLNANCNAAKAVPKDGAPSATSGWYLGSLGQYYYLKNNIGKVFSSMQRAGLDTGLVSTWTSTEYEYDVDMVYTVSILKTSVVDYKASKQSAEGILPILTF